MLDSKVSLSASGDKKSERYCFREVCHNLCDMAPSLDGAPGDVSAIARRQCLGGASGPAAILMNGRAFSITCFACIGG